MKKQWTYTGLVLISALIIGSLTGVIASVLTNRSFDRYIQSLSNEEILLSLSQIKPDPVPGTYEEALSNIYNTQDQLALFFAKSSSSSWITIEDSLGTGIVITDDGWILVGKDVARKSNQVYVNDKFYNIDEILEDTITDFALIKIDATGLSTVTFGSSQDVQNGQMIFALNDTESLTVSSIIKSDFYPRDASWQLENDITRWHIINDLDTGVPIANSSGHIIAFTEDNNFAIPFYQVEPFIDSVLEYREVQHAALGAYIFDIEFALNANFEQLGTRHGFMISDFVYKGPLSKSDLEIGDIIVSVDGIEVSGEYSVARALTDHVSGDEVIIGYIKSGEYKEDQITCVDYSDLIY